MPSASFSSFISTIVKDSTDTSILLSTVAKSHLDELVTILVNLLANNSRTLLGNGGNVTIKVKHVEGAVQAIFDGELAAKVVEVAKAAEERYKNAKGGAQAKRAGLILSPVRVFNIMKRYALCVSPSAAVFATATVEFVIRQIVQLGAKYTTEQKRSKINISHLQHVVNNDAGLCEFMNKNQIMFLEKTFRKKGGLKQTKGGKRKHKSGIVARRDVIKQQKSDTLAVFHTTFTNNWKRTGVGKDFRTSNAAKLAIQQFTEKLITAWVVKANTLKESEKSKKKNVTGANTGTNLGANETVNTGTTGKKKERTLSEKHLLLACDMIMSRFDVQPQNPGKTIEAAQRIAHRAGSSRNTSGAKQMIAEYLVGLATLIVSKAGKVTLLSKKSNVNKPTIGVTHVQKALALNGYYITVCNDKRKTSTKPATVVDPNADPLAPKVVKVPKVPKTPKEPKAPKIVKEPKAKKENVEKVKEPKASKSEKEPKTKKEEKTTEGAKNTKEKVVKSKTDNNKTDNNKTEKKEDKSEKVTKVDRTTVTSPKKRKAVKAAEPVVATLVEEVK